MAARRLRGKQGVAVPLGTHSWRSALARLRSAVDDEWRVKIEISEETCETLERRNADLERQVVDLRTRLLDFAVQSKAFPHVKFVVVIAGRDDGEQYGNKMMMLRELSTIARALTTAVQDDAEGPAIAVMAPCDDVESAAKWATQTGRMLVARTARHCRSWRRRRRPPLHRFRQRRARSLAGSTALAARTLTFSMHAGPIGETLQARSLARAGFSRRVPVDIGSISCQRWFKPSGGDVALVSPWRLRGHACSTRLCQTT